MAGRRAYGSWTGGTITVGYRLTFAGGNTALGDSVTFNGRAGREPSSTTVP